MASLKLRCDSRNWAYNRKFSYRPCGIHCSGWPAKRRACTSQKHRVAVIGAAGNIAALWPTTDLIKRDELLAATVQHYRAARALSPQTMLTELRLAQRAPATSMPPLCGH
jgi:hypothetical protein